MKKQRVNFDSLFDDVAKGKMNEIPNCPTVEQCQCYNSPEEPCVCGITEKALRKWASQKEMSPMTNEQREWCLSEIDNVEGYRRADWETCLDYQLADGVLRAWMDYCRDKGLL